MLPERLVRLKMRLSILWQSFQQFALRRCWTDTITEKVSCEIGTKLFEWVLTIIYSSITFNAASCTSILVKKAVLLGTTAGAAGSLWFVIMIHEPSDLRFWNNEKRYIILEDNFKNPTDQDLLNSRNLTDCLTAIKHFKGINKYECNALIKYIYTRYFTWKILLGYRTDEVSPYLKLW